MQSQQDQILELQDQVKDLREELHLCRVEIARLRRSVEGIGSTVGGESAAGSEARSESLVQAPASLGSYNLVSEAAGVQRPGSAVEPARGPLTWGERERIAEGVGKWIIRCLSGGPRGSSGRDLLPYASRVWLVIRDFEGSVRNPVVVCSTFTACRTLVKRGSDVGDSVFVGLPSQREAKVAISAAGLQWPEP